jgi:hypothetical protein
MRFTILREKSNQKSHSRSANGIFDGECPYGDLFRTPHKRKIVTSILRFDDNFELKNRKGLPALPIFRQILGTA